METTVKPDVVSYRKVGQNNIGKNRSRLSKRDYLRFATRFSVYLKKVRGKFYEVTMDHKDLISGVRNGSESPRSQEVRTASDTKVEVDKVVCGKTKIVVVRVRVVSLIQI